MMMNRCETEIDAIRLKLYEETKDLTIKENNNRLKELGQRLSTQYEFTIVESAWGNKILKSFPNLPSNEH